MDDFSIIKDILIILIVSIPIIFLFKKLNLPSIIGFLIAGVIIGPHSFGLIQSHQGIEVMAEIGVILLLFTIGLEVSFSNLMKIKKFLIIAGGSQVGITVAVGFIIFYFFGVSAKQAFFLGMLLSLSSTAVVLKLLSDRGELEAPQGRISLGILIFQDLMIVPMFLVLPILTADPTSGIGEISLQIIISFSILGLLIVLSRFLMPKLMYQLANLRLTEAFTIGIILLLLGTAYITHSAGLSFALGSFIAGLILAESDYNTQILSDIIPLKDAFNTIFFVSIGLLLDLNYIAENLMLVILITVGVLLLKSVIISAIVLLIKYPFRIALITGIGLAQVGEFSFILSRAGLNYDLINSEYYKIFLASAIFTMILTPFLLRFAHSINFSKDKINDSQNEISAKKSKFNDHVIIAGYGLNGKNVSRVLRETGIKYVVIELNPDTVRIEKNNKENIIFGDISKYEVLHSAGIEHARVIVFAISDPNITKRSLKLAKRLNSKLYTVVRTRYVKEIEELKELGADVVIPEEFETSLEIFKKVLQHYHLPLNIIMRQTGILRGESYKLLREASDKPDAFLHFDEILAEGLTETYYVNEDNPYLNKELREINLRNETSATIIAIVRDGKTISNPASNEKLLSHDTLVITGDHFAVDKAVLLLNGQ